jgi:hypothetical protein
MSEPKKNLPKEPPDNEDVKAAFNSLRQIYQNTPPEQRRQKLAEEIAKRQQARKGDSTSHSS